MKHLLLTIGAILLPQMLQAQCYQNGIPCGQPVSSSPSGGSGSTTPTGSTVISGSDGVTSVPIRTDGDGRLITTFSPGSPLPAGSNAIGSITNTAFGATQSGTWNVGVTGPVSVSGEFYPSVQNVSQSGNWTTAIGGTLPAFAVTPTVNLGSISGVATEETLASVLRTLGTPFQQNGAISNTAFGATQSGTWSVGLTGTLPAFAATPTVNLGTLNGAATAAKQDATIAALGTPFQAGGMIGNTTFATTVASGANVDLSAMKAVLPSAKGRQPMSNSLSVALASDGDHAKSSDITAMQAQLHTDLTAPLKDGTNTIGNVLRAIAFNETTTPLSAGSTFTPPSPRDSGPVGSATPYTTFSCFARADQTGTLLQQGSNDGTTWYTELSGTLSANVATTTTGKIYTRYHRCQVTNGSSSQNTLVVNSQLGS